MKARPAAMPKGWRQEVVKMLEKDGISISVQTVTNIMNGSRASLELQAKVHQARQKIAKRHASMAERVKRLSKVA